MEPRIATELYKLDRTMVDTACRKVGFEQSESEPNEEELDYIENKGLTLFQWKLLNLFKHMFDQELFRCRQIQEFQDWLSERERVKCSGLTFYQSMLYNQEIAEHIFKVWATNLGIISLYDRSRKADENDIEDRTHIVDFCLDTFNRELKKVKNRKKFRVVEPDYKPGALVTVQIQGVRNSSGKNVYQRFVEVLKMLQE